MALFVDLAAGIEELVSDGDSLALEGFSHLVPFAAGHELLRQGQTDLTLIRMVPDLIADQLIGMGRLRRLVFSWAGNPGVGSLHRFRDAVEHDWPRPLELEEHSHAGMANRYVAGASGLPFALMRGYTGTDLVGPAEATGTLAFVDCPFSGEKLAAVAAVRPDVAIVHAQRADREGNVQLWGIVGVQKEAVLAARRSLVTVEEVVEELEPVAGQVILPSWTVDRIAVAPGGAHPTYAQDYSVRDDDFFVAWDAIARDRERFAAWIEENVIGVAA
jgi:glutaconate CoA-transferase, subunit A